MANLHWRRALAAFGAGVFLANVIPHFVAGVTGQLFPTPFASPPGVGLSSPLVNVIWALMNLLIGYALLRAGRVAPAHRGSMIALFLGISGVAIALSVHFGAVMGNPSF